MVLKVFALYTIYVVWIVVSCSFAPPIGRPAGSVFVVGPGAPIGTWVAAVRRATLVPLCAHRSGNVSIHEYTVCRSSLSPKETLS